MKNWLIEIGIKKLGPSAIRGAILGISGWLIMKDGLLSSYGIVSDSVARTTTISWDKLNAALIVALPAIIAAVVKLLNHQATTMMAKPQEDTKPEPTIPPAV